MLFGDEPGLQRPNGTMLKIDCKKNMHAPVACFSVSPSLAYGATGQKHEETVGNTSELGPYERKTTHAPVDPRATAVSRDVNQALAGTDNKLSMAEKI